ncbi:MAG: VWA domain-containing protein, partial [Myxococcota bacterium]
MLFARPKMVMGALLVASALNFGVAQEAAAQCDRPQVLLVVDRSSSMLNSLPGGGTLWDGARSAIDTMTTSFEDSIDFGLQVFPLVATGGNPGGRCEPGAIEVSIGRNTSASIQSELLEPPPESGNWTPMSQTLDAAFDYAPLRDADRESVVVLITDGWQFCDPYDPATRFDVVRSVERLRDEGITTYIVGFGGSVD